MNLEAANRIQKLMQRYLLYQVAAVALTSLGMAAIFFSLTKLWSDSLTVKGFVGGLTGGLAIIFLALRYRLFNINTIDIARFLNHQYPALQQSADLLIKNDEQLTNLEKIQRDKVVVLFSELYPEIKLPHRLLLSSLVFIVSIGLSVLLSSFLTRIDGTKDRSPMKGTEEIVTKKNPSAINSFEILIIPPAYTSRPAFQSKGFELTIPAGSNVQWQIGFQGYVNDPKFIFSNRDSVLLPKSGEKYLLDRQFFQSGFYQAKWTDEVQTQWSDFYRIEVIQDESPKIAVTNLTQFTRIKYSDTQEINIVSQLSDDYALTNAGIIATVSKGSGEGIKFREERLLFTTPSVIRGKQVNASASLNLKKLGLEPGDELYFYIEAFDNKSPGPNRSRTETFFIALQDTTKNEVIEDTGLGVDLMPDYFRSQRQIIIDTEKLLKDKVRISKKQFNATSNELGFDQKTLRLKYGQFLGEEEDSGIATDVAEHLEEEVEDEKDEDLMKKFGHQHDKDNEHNLVLEKKTDHQHEEESTDPDKPKDPLAAFVHSHDNSEMATFFEQSLRAKLKAALSVMWDAELQLRLYQPEKSLPYQYTALKLLKEISNDSRIYVHRTGFDPPPLKEEKRLTADLSEVKNSTHKSVTESETDFPNIREVLTIIETLLQKPDSKLSPAIQLTFQRAGAEFSAIALEKPSLLSGLGLLKRLTDNQLSSTDRGELLKLRSMLWQSLPDKIPSPSRQTGATTQLDQLFILQLEGNLNE